VLQPPGGLIDLNSSDRLSSDCLQVSMQACRRCTEQRQQKDDLMSLAEDRIEIVVWDGTLINFVTWFWAQSNPTQLGRFPRRTAKHPTYITTGPPHLLFWHLFSLPLPSFSLTPLIVLETSAVASRSPAPLRFGGRYEGPKIDCGRSDRPGRRPWLQNRGTQGARRDPSS
jgi:hypothetical protein